MVLKVEILCCHGTDSIRCEAGGGCETGAGRDDDVAAISAGERLGHLTTAVKELHRPERFPGALVVFPGIERVEACGRLLVVDGNALQK